MNLKNTYTAHHTLIVAEEEDGETGYEVHED